MAPVLVAVEREHARADDLCGREARVVDGERARIAHRLQHEIAPGDEPRVERRHPRDRLALAEPGEQRDADRAPALRASTTAPSGNEAPMPATIDSRLMATTATDRKLLIDGEWVETGDWVEVALAVRRRRPWRVSRGRAPRRRVERSTRLRGRWSRRCPRTSAPRSSCVSPARSAAGPTRQPGRSPPRRASRSRPRASRWRGRCRRTRWRRSRPGRSTGEMVPMDASAGRRGEARVHPAPPDRRRRRDLAVQLPAQPRRAQDRACARRRLRRRAQARLADAALRAPPRGARGRGRAAAGLAERRRRAVRPRSETCSSRTSGSS